MYDYIMYEIGMRVFFAYKLEKAVILELLPDHKMKVRFDSGEESIEFNWQSQQVLE